MKSVEIDRSKRLIDQPNTGHNRWHPDIPPVLEVNEGEEVVLETRDALDGQLAPSATAASLATMDAGIIHPLTGPVLVKGARPGDLLEVEFIDILPQRTRSPASCPGSASCATCTRTLPRALAHRRRLGHLDGASRRADSRRTVHGRHRGGAIAGAGRRVGEA